MPKAAKASTDSKLKATSKPPKGTMPKAKAAPKSKARVEKKKKGTVIRYLDLFSALLTRSSDPNAPKRGLSAYMFFANDQRDTVREENPGISFGIAFLFDHRRHLTRFLQAKWAKS